MCLNVEVAEFSSLTRTGIRVFAPPAAVSARSATRAGTARGVGRIHPPRANRPSGITSVTGRRCSPRRSSGTASTVSESADATRRNVACFAVQSSRRTEGGARAVVSIGRSSWQSTTSTVTVPTIGGSWGVARRRTSVGGCVITATRKIDSVSCATTAIRRELSMATARTSGRHRLSRTHTPAEFAADKKRAARRRRTK